jgi:hypothetical protein
MPTLLKDGLPERGSRSKFDFLPWADGQAWKFVKGEDYDSSTETFRYNVRRWARSRGFEAAVRPYPAIVDRRRASPPRIAGVRRAGAIVSRAAGELGCSQSALSQHVAQLERLLAVRLVGRRRGSSEVTPTPQGAALLRHAAPILAV